MHACAFSICIPPEPIFEFSLIDESNDFDDSMDRFAYRA